MLKPQVMTVLSIVTPAILAGTFGYAIATFIAVALANWLH